MEWRGAWCGLKENRTLQVAILPFDLSVVELEGNFNLFYS
jgi:hypothetical protein